MSSFSKKVGLPVLLLIAFPSMHAQGALDQILPRPSAPANSSTHTSADPLGRGTPAGTVFGFLQAAQSGNYSMAAQYLQLSPARRQTEGEQLAAKLKVVMDRALAGSLKDVSTQPEGTPQEGVPPDRQKLGIMSSGDIETDLELVRVSDPKAGKIWLISSDTLTKIPELYDQVEARQVENRLPKFLVKHQFAGMPVWQWLALLIAIPVAAAIGGLFLLIIDFPVRWWGQRRGKPEVAKWRLAFGPAWLFAATVAHKVLASYLGILWRGIQWFLRNVRNRALAHGRGGTGSLLQLGERVAKAGVFVAAAFFVLGTLGFNMTTALAGLGIGGLAVGFGAQKTIENLFGGVSVLGDEVIRVGDVCRFGDRAGTVEDIGLRSTRVRTEERTLLAIPNGTVATINVENLSRRDQILFKTNLGLRLETKADHLRFVLAEIRRLLYSHAKVDTKSVRVRLVDITSGSHTVEVFCYILTQDFNEFAAVREDLLLRMIDLVEESGTDLARPSQTLYVGRDSGVETEKADKAVQKIAELRDGKQLPFPDFSTEHISSLRGSIDYPQSESVLRNDQHDSGPKR